MADDEDDDIQQFMRSMIHEHLGEILATSQFPPPDEPVSRQQFQIWVRIMIEHYRKISSLNAELLQAAWGIILAESEQDAESSNDFLQRVDWIIRSGGSFGKYLESILLEFSRRQWFASDQPTSPADGLALARHSGPCVTVHVADNTLSLFFHDVLPTFWGTRLDTACHGCQMPIVQEPTVRTIAPVKPNLTAGPGVHVRVVNRHFTCLKASNVLWVPVSHVWHDSIRRANDSETHDDEAAATMVGSLEALLDASVDSYGPEVEFWHDYFSVPQWEQRTKVSLLLQIPSIYHGAKEILVHMSDIPGAHIRMLLSEDHLKSPTLNALRFMHVLHVLCSSQWLQRTWVMLEYSFCRRACVMDKSGHIWRSPDQAMETENDTLATILQRVRHLLNWIDPYSGTFVTAQRRELLGGAAVDNLRRWPGLCLGEAIEFIAKKQCQVLRDRFFASHMLAHRNPTPNADAIPLSTRDACQYVWKAALERQDFSPLLLQPRETSPGSNPAAGIPSWLVGHNGLDHAEWGLGSQGTPAQSLVSVEGDRVKAELEVVGSIERIHFLDANEAGNVKGVEWAIGLLGSLAGDAPGELSTADLIDGLNRIFPSDTIFTRAALSRAAVEYTMEGLQRRDSGLEANVQHCLTEYFSSPSGSPRRQYAAQSLIRIMKYDKDIMRRTSRELTRIIFSGSIAFRRAQRGAIGGEPICEARCVEPSCQVLTVLRLDLRADAGIGDTVYRIPGLSYDRGVEDGVGVVLNKEGRITGRMLYGPPKCPCRLRKMVEIR